MTEQPRSYGFEYEVRLAVSLPSTWTTFLKRVASAHYDYKCREAARAGMINGLHNTSIDGEHRSSYALAWRDLDLITKVMEQAHHHSEDLELAAAIGAWFRDTKAALETRLDVILAIT